MFVCFSSDIQYCNIVNPPKGRPAKTASFILQGKSSVRAEKHTCVFELMAILQLGFKSFFNFTPFFLLTKVLKHISIFENNFPIGNINQTCCSS